MTESGMGDVREKFDPALACVPMERREVYHVWAAQWTPLGRHAFFYEPPDSAVTDFDRQTAETLLARRRMTFAQIVTGPAGAMLSAETFWPRSIDFPAGDVAIDRKMIVQADLAMIDAMENALLAVQELEAARARLSASAFLSLERQALTFKAVVTWLRMMMLASMEITGVREGTFRKAKSAMIGRLCDVRRVFAETSAITISVPDDRPAERRRHLERWVADFSDAVNALPETFQ
jgi:hypothetical protein